MNESNYLEIVFNTLKKEDTDVIMALLSEVDFEGFDETEDALKAYIKKEKWDEQKVKEIVDEYHLSYTKHELHSQNWNALWESNFEPVMIDDFVAVRAHFHQPIKFVQHEIIITPKMSFGTGHHATTTMMIEQMRHLDFNNKTVFDFGTGTGILSILAEKLGAAEILAIDNDEWSIENSKENIEQNHCTRIQVEQKENAQVNATFDIILANINRNVIVENLSLLSSQFIKGGYLLLSGLLEEDEEVILSEVTHYQLIHVNTLHRLQWISLLFSR